MKCSLGISNFLEEISAAAAAAMSLQLCPTLYDPMNCIVHGILQARIVEWLLEQLFPSPGDLPNPEIEPRSPALQADSLQGLSHPGSPPGKVPAVGPRVPGITVPSSVYSFHPHHNLVRIGAIITLIYR